MYLAATSVTNLFLTHSFVQYSSRLSRVFELRKTSVSAALVGQEEGQPACKETGYWFVGGDSLTGAFAGLIAAPLLPPTPSSLLQ